MPAPMSFALTHFACLGLLCAVFYAAGVVSEWFLPPITSATLGKTLVRLTVGSIVVTYLLFVLASVQLFRVRVALPICGVLLLAATIRESWRLRARITQHCFRLRQRLERSGKAALYGVPAGLCMLATAANTLTRTIGVDCDVYHLTLPQLYIKAGGFLPVPFNVYANWPHSLELLYGLAMMLKGYVLAKLVHGVFLALLLVAVLRICRQRASPVLAIVATLLVLGNPVVLFEAERAYIDLGFSFYFLIAVACAVEFLGASLRRWPLLVLSGACCGAMAGCKLSGLTGVVCVGAWVCGSLVMRGSINDVPRAAAALGVPTLALALPWFAKTYLYTGTPFYPFVAGSLDGSEWQASLTQEFYRWQQSMGMGRSFADYLLLPLRVVRDGARGYSHFDGSLSKLWLGAVPLALVMLPWTKSARGYLACASGYFVLWAGSSQQLRFLIAALPLFAVAAVLGAHTLLGQVRVVFVPVLLQVAILAAVGVTLRPILEPELSRAVMNARRLATKGPDSAAGQVPEGYRVIHKTTPPTAKIMLLNINRTFFLQRQSICDSFFEASQMNMLISQAPNEQGLVPILKRWGVTHVYVTKNKHKIPYPPWLERFFQSSTWVRRVYQCKGRGCTLYELK
jgi:hypothetical protein